jgi:hypothetical protein
LITHQEDFESALTSAPDGEDSYMRQKSSRPGHRLNGIGSGLAMVMACDLLAGLASTGTAPDGWRFFKGDPEGAGALIATDNGSSVDHRPFPSHDRAVQDGVAVALVRGARTGRFTVTAT